MHERALMEDLMREILRLAELEGAGRVTRVQVSLGALSHFTPGHFAEHFEDVARGTVAETARIDARLETSVQDQHATGVRLTGIEVS